MKITDRFNAGMVVQLNPDTVKNKMFSGCFMIITEVKSWGCKGYVQALGTNGKPGGMAYYRAGFREIEPAGYAVWIAVSEETEQD